MHRLLSAALAVAFLCASAPAADAQTARQMRQEVEASMLVTGHVDIDRSGQVTAHELDQRDKLPSYVVNLIERAVPALRFEPVLVDGAPVLARAKMNVRLIATAVGNGEMRMRIASAHFGELYSDSDRTSVRRVGTLRPPHYPMNIAQIGGKGTVYLVLKVDRDGGVEDVVAEQINLTALDSARQMEMIRDSLAKAAVDNARKRWMFVPPTEGEEAAKPYWVVRVPVDFMFEDDRHAAYGQWSAYHPGERVRPEWTEPTSPGFSPDTLIAGGITPETSRFKLLTPFEG